MNPIAEVEAQEQRLRHLLGGERGFWLSLARVPVSLLRQGLLVRSADPILSSQPWLEVFERFERHARGVFRSLHDLVVDRAVRVLGPSAIEWQARGLARDLAEQRLAELLAGLERKSASNLRGHLRRALRVARGRQGLRPAVDELALVVAQELPVTPRQAIRIRAIAARRRRSGLDERVVGRLEERARRAAVAARARGWASDVISRSVNAGRIAAWSAAAEAGAVAKPRKRSRHQGDSRVRPSHRRQASMPPVDLDVPFQIFGVPYPPFGAGCRCWVEIDGE